MAGERSHCTRRSQSFHFIVDLIITTLADAFRGDDCSGEPSLLILKVAFVNVRLVNRRRCSCLSWWTETGCTKCIMPSGIFHSFILSIPWCSRTFEECVHREVVYFPFLGSSECRLFLLVLPPIMGNPCRLHVTKFTPHQRIAFYSAIPSLSQPPFSFPTHLPSTFFFQPSYSSSAGSSRCRTSLSTTSQLSLLSCG
jgi:hypothetical protein